MFITGVQKTRIRTAKLNVYLSINVYVSKFNQTVLLKILMNKDVFINKNVVLSWKKYFK